MFINSFTYINDKFISTLIDKFLNETIYAESKSQTFENLIDNMFKNLDLSIYIAAFLDSEKNNVDDNKWMSATNSCISQTIYATFSNVGGIYYKLVSTDFSTNNKMMLINDFIKKYCQEKGIRTSIMEEIMANRELLTNTIGSLLGDALIKENNLKNEEKLQASVIFELNSKESITYTLPQLDGNKSYFFEVEPGYGLGIIQNNILTYTPPTVLEKTRISAEIIVLDSNGFIESRNYINIDVNPPKYLKPTFNTIRIRPSATISVNLEEVSENYSYSASVPTGFGSVLIENQQLKYTAPATALGQNVGVKLTLLWNNTNVVYETVINFQIVVDGSDVDISDVENEFTILKEKVNSNSEQIENIKNELGI